jgi:hypothetical protein
MKNAMANLGQNIKKIMLLVFVLKQLHLFPVAENYHQPNKTITRKQFSNLI